MPGARRWLAAAALLLLAARPVGAAGPRVDPEQAPRADPSVLRALNRGDQILNVIVGVRDGTPSPRLLAAHPDSSGEPGRRAARLAAQERLAKSMKAGQFELRRRYESFSMMSARVTREGALALANRGDVAWVTIDGIRKMQAPAPQAAQVLVRSDQTNSAGFSGAGQTIAVVDTGVDYTVADLGGGSFPNTKVVGGKDFGDGDDDPMDCEGHGTSVAAVAAGPTGVAPAAKIVALKVAKTSKCAEADDSVILDAINWAITNRATYGISVINLSFGSSPTDGLDQGYCDADNPHYVTAIETAAAAGIAFVASAGNDALSNAIATPACVSSAVSAGAVYPLSYASVSWADDNGGTLCTDQPAVPDGIVCFSDSASNLTLLAPGAFWYVATKGGGAPEFDGTSAAAPAVSGALALLRQAHPSLGPAAAAALLRTTGRTIADPRNGIITPRIDTLAAVQLSGTRFAASGSIPVPVPDGVGSATVTATTAGFSGSLASVRATVEIAHNDPRQLRVTLTGPDGTAVILHDHSGAPNHPISGVYGLTRAPAQSLGAFEGKAANGVWILSVVDDVATISGSVRSFAVELVPGQPLATIPAGADSEVSPIVGHVQGTKLFLSDARIYNPSAEAQTLSLFYVAQGLAGSQAVRSTRTVAPGHVLALNDLVGAEFGYANSVGELTLVGPDTSAIVTCRSYTQGSSGTFGLFVPAFRAADALAPGQTATANGLSRTLQFHTNAGFTEVSGEPVSVKMDIRNAAGDLLASTTRGTAANGSLLVTDIIGDRGLGTTSNFRIDYTVVSATGRVIPFAAFVDDTTGDGLFEAAVNPALSGGDIVVPQVSHASGANGDFFQTDLHISNIGPAPVSVTISLIPRVLTGTSNLSETFAIAPGQTIERLDVLAADFGLADPSAAGLRIHPGGPARLAVSSRTYVSKQGGTFGFSIAGVDAAAAIGAGDGTATVIQLDQRSSAQGYRSNFGFAEVGGADATVLVTARSGDTGADLGARAYAVRAGQSFQTSVADLVGSAGADNVYLRFTVTAGSGRVLAYGTSIDNISGDAIYIPAQKEP